MKYKPNHIIRIKLISSKTSLDVCLSLLLAKHPKNSIHEILIENAGLTKRWAQYQTPLKTRAGLTINLGFIGNDWKSKLSISL